MSLSVVRFAAVFCAGLCAAALSACGIFSPSESAASAESGQFAVPPAQDYANPSNWIVCGGDEEESPDFEIFYVYPTLFSNASRPIMDCRFASIRRKTEDYTQGTRKLILGGGRKAVMYAPYVRQADYSTCMRIDLGSNPGESLLRYGIEDTRAAFRYFMEKKHKPGVPVMLLGHSQGAIDLYELLRTSPEITPKDGFAAAYLAGLPRKTAAEIDRDFSGRMIRRGAGADDTGVLLVWNSQTEDAENEKFAAPGGFVINPLNWKTDETPSDGSEQKNAYYYAGGIELASPFDSSLLDGIHADPGRGVLIVPLAADGVYDSNAAMGRGVFHMNDVFFFAESIGANMAAREAAWRIAYGSKP